MSRPVNLGEWQGEAVVGHLSMSVSLERLIEGRAENEGEGAWVGSGKTM